MKKLVLFDTDAATDDMVALFYLLAHPDVILKAITVSGTGEAHGVKGAKNIAALCHFLNMGMLPIAYGSDSSCGESGHEFPDYLRTLMDNIFEKAKLPDNPHPNISDSAVALIKKTLEDADGKVSIVATGPLTNIAECIEQHSHLNNKITEIVIMGGAVKVPGNINGPEVKTKNKVAEWNIYADPKAADIVFKSGIPITLVPLDATNKVPMTEDFYRALSSKKSEKLQLIFTLFKDLVDYAGMDRFLSNFYLWDALAAMICLDPDLAVFQTLAIRLNVETAQTEMVSEKTPGANFINVATDLKCPEHILPILLKTLEKKFPAQVSDVSQHFFYAKEQSEGPRKANVIPTLTNSL